MANLYPAKEGLQVLVEKAANMFLYLCFENKYAEYSYVDHKVKYQSKSYYKVSNEENEVKNTSDFKYLGVIINSNATISGDIERLCFFSDAIQCGVPLVKLFDFRLFKFSLYLF